MVRIETGMMARSLAGHDRRKIYIIIRTDGEYVWLTDGICHTVENPKKKRRKHIQVIHRIPEPAGQILISGQTLKNEHIIQAIQSEGH